MGIICKILLLVFVSAAAFNASAQRSMAAFNGDWKFLLGDDSAARQENYNDDHWRKLDLPHDWSIEGTFSKDHPTTFNQAALPAGIGWYRKSFSIPSGLKEKKVYIIFDGVYRNSEVWINGHYLGKRPNGYIQFRYELTPFLKTGKEKNVIAVKVDNSLQPNSRWYTGSGIYRNVWLLTTGMVALADTSVFISTSNVSTQQATIHFQKQVLTQKGYAGMVNLVHEVIDPSGKLVSSNNNIQVMTGALNTFAVNIPAPQLWSPSTPHLYKARIKVYHDKKLIDQYETSFGIRHFNFDATKGFFLNSIPMKILGVCLHHDLGALGAAVNYRAIERQLVLLKNMGCNAIRMAHNPPAPEMLELCDKLGFLVMDEAFDMWKKKKNRYDYSMDFLAWHKTDLEDQVRHHRNHPSIIMWSIGNEIREQFDSSGIQLTKDLVATIKALDTTRPVTCALTENIPSKNFIYQSGALDVLGFNYKPEAYPELPSRFPGEKFIASETASALATRGHYDMPSDSNRLWPPDSKPFTAGNPDYTVSAYDHVYAYWGTTHEKSWQAVKKYDHMSGIFVWSGFDFLGEPVPYQWPARSSYYGIIDLAGFPKDVYYMYQSEWTRKPVLHLFPHWNWQPGKMVDVWAYYNHADEVELYLNGRSLGKRKKEGDSLHVMWRIAFENGTLRAVSRQKGKIVLSREIKTAGLPASIELVADKLQLQPDGTDLSFVTVRIVDEDGNLVPDAEHLVKFSVSGPARIAGVDNGDPVSKASFKAPERESFHGLCLVILQSTGKKGEITLQASTEGLRGSTIRLKANVP